MSSTYSTCILFVGAFIFSSSSWAAGVTGMGTPVHGGGVTGSAEMGTPGLFFTPTAAWVDQPEFMLDLGLIHSQVAVTLESEDTISSDTRNLVPALALATPLGPLGMGLSLSTPYARSSDPPDDGPGRFHSTTGSLLVAESGLSLAGSPAPGFVLGFSLRAAFVSMESGQAVDTGAMLSDLSEDSDLTGYAFLEGSQTMTNAIGAAGGFAAGARFETGSGLIFGGHYRSNLWGEASGDFTYIPSNDLTVEIQGSISTGFLAPQEAGFFAVVPAAGFELIPEVGWEQWEAWSRIESTITDSKVQSSDPTFDQILDATGVELADLIGDVGGTVTQNNTRNVWTARLGTVAPLGENWQLRGAVGVAPAAVPDEYVHPSNLDYTSIDLRGGIAWFGPRRTQICLTGDLFLLPDRTITDSAYDTESESGLPSGNGNYELSMTRIGITLIQNFGN